MTMTLTQQVPSEGDAIYYTPEWRTMIESHMPLLKARSDTVSLPIQPYNAHRFDGDLMGVLTELGISPMYHWLIMRFNGMDSPTQYSETMLILKHPELRYVDLLTQIHRTTMQKIK